MGLVLEYTSHQTALDEDEKEGLMIKSITTRQELDEFEQLNIEKAIDWTMRKRFKVSKILNEKFICKLHKRMFDRTWAWAGEFRRTNKNIGIDKYRIGTELGILLNDCKYWIENNIFSPDEIAIRLKHRIVKIHPFTNGNGRHSRLFADIMAQHVFDRPVFTWGSQKIDTTNRLRSDYLQALFQADSENFKPLIEFARR